MSRCASRWPIHIEKRHPTREKHGNAAHCVISDRKKQSADPTKGHGIPDARHETKWQKGPNEQQNIAAVGGNDRQHQGCQHDTPHRSRERSNTAPPKKLSVFDRLRWSAGRGHWLPIIIMAKTSTAAPTARNMHGIQPCFANWAHCHSEYLPFEKLAMPNLTGDVTYIDHPSRILGINR